MPLIERGHRAGSGRGPRRPSRGRGGAAPRPAAPPPGRRPAATHRAPPPPARARARRRGRTPTPARGGGAQANRRTEVGDRIRLGGPDGRRNPRIATRLSLAVHGLASNALSYGSLSKPEGKVSVEWTVKDGQLDLEWRESDGPTVRPPKQKGYGTRVVERVLAAEFGGTAELDFASEGVVLRLSAPAEGLGREATQWSMK